MAELSDVFEGIMALNRWNGVESRSGPGSTLAYTQNLRPELARFVRESGVNSLFDAPCGDFHWMAEVEFPLNFDYFGGDVAPSLIDDLRVKQARPGRRFAVFDIVHDPFPPADLWLCRDCLFHLSRGECPKSLAELLPLGHRLCDAHHPSQHHRFFQ